MCGLAGHTGILDNAARYKLTKALAIRIDDRGGDACGFVAVSKRGRLRYERDLGLFEWADPGFLERAASGSRLTLLHTRFATTGSKTLPNAHPFAIEREGRVILYGAHNGVLGGTRTTARAFGRDHTVDSREFFELLADGETEVIKRDVTGYGAVTWIDNDRHDRIRVCRLTDDGALVMYRLESGGYVWASTRGILESALREAGLTPTAEVTLETGAVINVYPDRVSRDPYLELTVSKGHGYYGWYDDDYGDEPFTSSHYGVEFAKNPVTGVWEPHTKPAAHREGTTADGWGYWTDYAGETHRYRLVDEADDDRAIEELSGGWSASEAEILDQIIDRHAIDDLDLEPIDDELGYSDGETPEPLAAMVAESGE